jgi:hypothetical protein
MNRGAQLTLNVRSPKKWWEAIYLITINDPTDLGGLYIYFNTPHRGAKEIFLETPMV